MNVAGCLKEGCLCKGKLSIRCWIWCSILALQINSLELGCGFWMSAWGGTVVFYLIVNYLQPSISITIFIANTIINIDCSVNASQEVSFAEVSEAL